MNAAPTNRRHIFLSSSVRFVVFFRTNFSKSFKSRTMLFVNISLQTSLLLLLLLASTSSTVFATCPTSYSVDCFSWSEEGGQCQALHAVVRLRDNAGLPVIGANVEVIANRPISGGKKQGKYVRTTSATLSTNYQGEVDVMCTADPLPYQGTTAAFCWQQGLVGFAYQITVVAISWPACPNAVWTPDPAQDVDIYTFTGQACS
jgi:hypothetical protein